MNKDDPLTLKAIDDLHLAVSEYERLVEKESLEDELQSTKDQLAEMTLKANDMTLLHDMWRDNAKDCNQTCHELLGELDRARDVAVKLEAEIAACPCRDHHYGADQ